MTAWCGEFSGQGTWLHWTVNPCILESVSSVLLVCTAALVLSFQCRKIVLLRQKKYPGSNRIPSAAVAFCVCILCVVAAHAALLIASIVVYIRGTARYPYELFNQSASLLLWLGALVTLYVGHQSRIAVQLKLLLWPALLAYALEVYTWALQMAGGWGPQSSVCLVYLLLTTLQLLAIAGAAGISPFMRPPHEEDELLKQALLGADVEAPASSKKKPWYELMWTAIVYVWPKTPILQLRACLCVLLLAIMRLLNLAVPILYRNMVNILSDAAIAASSGSPTGWQPTFWNVFYPVVFLYMLAAFFQGGAGTGSSGMLNNARSYLWIPIGQNAFRSISVDMFQKAMDLDLRWHLMRKTGEVTRVMDRGTSAIQQVLSTVLFSIVPQLFDVVAACIFISAELQVWIAVIVLITLGSYVPLTVILTEMRVKYRRDMNKYDNARGARVTDALLNYETVKVFGNEEYERNELDQCIMKYQDVEYKLMASLNGLNVLQSIIIFSGLIAGLMVCVKGVAEGRLTVGDAVLFITLMQQLYAPLNYFGSYYRTIQRQLIDMENCFELLATNAGLTDKPDARDIVPGKCSIEFRNASFSYVADAPVIKDISFTCPGGKTLAFVGATGSGKSSALRLIFRFYDPTSGAVFVDGQNIADVTQLYNPSQARLKLYMATQASLRSHMGFVPQDTVLFNDTILHNIRYGRPDATDEEVHEAAKAAMIHDSIVGRFPQQYDTIVGERGLRLSGGEKQRVAFARAILKNPRILLLDEATSSLDSLTERRIQEKLDSLRKGQTTVIVAHRLSTVMDADIIIVMQEGDIVEQGVHSELIQRGGLYAEMWQRQAEAAAIEEAEAPEGPPDVDGDVTAPSHNASEGNLSNGHGY